MINGRRLNENISPNQRRLRLKELSGVELTEKEKNILKRKVSEGVSMVEPSKYHNRITTPPSPIDDPTDLDDEIDLDEIIKELMGEGGVDDEELEINGLTKNELKEMIYQVLNDM
jgi:hypothetical protein